MNRSQSLGLPLHILIFTAATSHHSFSASPDGVEHHFAVNFLSQAVVAQALAPLMSASVSVGEKSKDLAAAIATTALGPSDVTHKGLRRSDGSVWSAEADPGRIIFVSCSAHQLSYRLLHGCCTPSSWKSAVMSPGAARMFMPFQAYGLSKLAQVISGISYCRS